MLLNAVCAAGAIAGLLGVWLLACDWRNEFIGPFLITGIVCLAISLIF